MNKEEQEFTDAQMLRQKAEEQLKAKQKKSSDLHTETDVTRLLHELQVHQIELEM
ncbi:MAG TPA: histidine kinase, partial [Prolixibacteraceae bacterium]|nr:histidine kinase [Prolixibacteraceae bacterium]